MLKLRLPVADAGYRRQASSCVPFKPHSWLSRSCHILLVATTFFAAACGDTIWTVPTLTAEPPEGDDHEIEKLKGLLEETRRRMEKTRRTAMMALAGEPSSRRDWPLQLGAIVLGAVLAGYVAFTLPVSPEHARTRAHLDTLEKQDMENLQERYKSDLANLRDETSRIYTQFQWLIGLVVTMIVALSGLILANLKRPEPKPVTSDDDTESDDKA